MKTFEEAARKLAKKENTACTSPSVHIPGMIKRMRKVWPDAPEEALWRALFDDVVAYRSFDPLDIAELVIRKQHDYGHENILAFGIPGIAVRVFDKWTRIASLTERVVEPLNESLIDSWRDIAGYALIAMMLTFGVFTLPLEKDVRN